MRKLYLLFVLAVFLVGFAHSVFRMEWRLANGTGILLRLAPVDPRAPLMGDYMALEYLANEAIFSALRDVHRRPAGGGGDWPDSGRAVMRGKAPLGEGVPAEAAFVRLDDGAPLEADEFFLAFRVRGNRVITAAPAFYFQEGHAGVYDGARYGRFSLDISGRTLLVALCDEQGRDILTDALPRQPER